MKSFREWWLVICLTSMPWIIIEPLYFPGVCIFRCQKHIIKYGLLNIFVRHVYWFAHLRLVQNDTQWTSFKAYAGRVIPGTNLKILFKDNRKPGSNPTKTFHQPLTRIKPDTFQLEREQTPKHLNPKMKENYLVYWYNHGKIV